MGETEDAGAGQRLLPDYQAGVQHGAGRVPRVVPAGAAARLHQGHRERLAGIPGNPRPRVVVDHRPDVRDAQAGRGGGRQRAAGARTGRRHQPREERQVDGIRTGNWLSLRQAQALLSAPDVRR